MAKQKITIFILLIIMFWIKAPSQDIEFILLKKYAENSFRDGDYEFALENYLELYRNDKKNINLNYHIGICYVETNIDKSKAIPHLEFVVGHNNYPIRSYFYLGRAYMYDYRFTEAVEAFYEFKMVGINEELLVETDRYIEMCYYALELINQPKNITFERLDSTINSPHDDYYPFITSDESSILFASRRTYVKEYEDYIANVFYSDSKRGIFSSALPLPVNTYDNEEVVGVTPNGENILVYANGDYFTHDIKMINRKGTKFTDMPASQLPFDINTEGVEMGACQSADGNTIYFASDRRGGRGGLDIYVSRKNASGTWGEAENIGSTINSVYDENFPNISPDGKRLYFASKGHRGIGGYDIFYSVINDETQQWSPPINMGFPINTPVDNTTITITGNDMVYYMSANRREGFGKLDIYRITKGDDMEQLFVIGSVYVGTQQNNVPYSEDFHKAYATVYDLYDNIIAQYEVQSESAQFFATLYAGRYKLEVKFSGAQKGHVEIFDINKNNAAEGLFKTIYLEPVY